MTKAFLEKLLKDVNNELISTNMRKPIGYLFERVKDVNTNHTNVSLSVWQNDFCVFHSYLTVTNDFDDIDWLRYEDILSKQFLTTFFIMKTDFQSRIERGEIQQFDKRKDLIRPAHV